MQAWSAPDVPRLPGRGLRVRTFDTATAALQPAASDQPARMYVCGITPYDATHMGHAATYVAFDLLNRAWRDAGHTVSYVQNVTDVDDPLLERAVDNGEDWRDIADRETELFRADMAALRVLPPDVYLGVVESIPLVVDLVQQLAKADAVYEVDGDLYFRVGRDPRFGSVGHLPTTVMRRLSAQRGGDPDRPGKEHPLDCLLWQGRRPGEPAWDSDLGPGRPGWHIECTAIALAHLGPAFDVQGGGRDLVFPHHEMCASQAHVALDSWPYARNYVHAGMVGLGGEKMSKSRGNLVFVSRLREAGADPSAIRLALLAHHYRSDWEWTEQDLRAASRRLARWRAAAGMGAGPGGAAVLAAVRAHLADDLDAPGALAAVDRWVEEALRADPAAGGGDPAAPAAVADLADALLGVDLRVGPAGGGHR